MPELAALDAAARMTQEAFRYGQHSLALGLRWDFMPKLALKFQVDQVWLNESNLVLDKRRSEEHTSELQSLMRISYAVFCLKKQKKTTRNTTTHNIRLRN